MEIVSKKCKKVFVNSFNHVFSKAIKKDSRNSCSVHCVILVTVYLMLKFPFKFGINTL